MSDERHGIAEACTVSREPKDANRRGRQHSYLEAVSH
jgi:hypothetical protein